MTSELTISVASRPALAAVLETVEIEAVIPDNDGFAPWWEGLLIERIGNANGSPAAIALLIEEYERLAARLDDLAADGDVDQNAVAAAQTLLWRALLSHAVTPCISWHRDSVVLFWTVGSVSKFFTIDATGFSYLEEADGLITEREDELPFKLWNAIFPLVHGLH